MYLFTTGDIFELTDFASATFDEWCAKGHLKQIDGGLGAGNHRRWSLPQAVGLIVANDIRNSDQGCAVVYVGAIVNAFGNIKESWLRSKIDKGSKYFVLPHQGKPLLTADGSYNRPNVQVAYRRVLKLAQHRSK